MLSFDLLNTEKQKLYKDMQRKLENYQIELEYEGIAYETLCEVYKAVLDDHPEFFWLTGSSKGLKKTIGDFFSVEFKPEVFEGTSIAKAKVDKVRFDSRVEKWAGYAMRNFPDDFGRVLFLHDYLLSHAEYRKGSANCHNAYGCLMEGNAVCSGYAAAFQVLMTAIGVECGRVTGRSSSSLTGDVSHVWNYIRLSDGYYFVDATWDDPIVNGRSDEDNLTHDFFCVDMNEIRKDHIFASDQFIPSVFGHRYNYYKYSGMYAGEYSFEKVKAIAVAQLPRNRKFSVKFDSESQLNAAVRDLINNNKVYDIPGVPHSIRYIKDDKKYILEVRI